MKFISPIISDASGTVGGAVYAKNRGGNYIRARVVPTQPRTAAQVAVRANFTANSKAWKALTSAQMAGWIALGTQITLRDSIGNSYKPTGEQMYVSLNQTLAALGKPAISTAPGTPDTVIGLGGLTVVASATGGTGSTNQFTVLVTTNTATQSILVRATAQVSPGRNFFGRSQYRQITSFFHPASGVKDITAAYNAKFGTMRAGSKISLVLIPVTDNGFQGSESRLDVIVAT